MQNMCNGFYNIILWLQYSMQVNLTPSKELYLAARKDMAYLLVLLATGLICLLPVGYTIAQFVNRMYTVHSYCICIAHAHWCAPSMWMLLLHVASVNYLHTFTACIVCTGSYYNTLYVYYIHTIMQLYVPLIPLLPDWCPVHPVDRLGEMKCTVVQRVM